MDAKNERARCMSEGAAILLCLLLAGCVQRGKDREPQPVFGSLETRHGTITIELCDEGRLYTLVAQDGKTLAHRVDARHLEEHFPEVHALVEEALSEGRLNAIGYQD